MAKLVTIKAKPGMRIRIPSENYRVLPEEGAVVQWNMHWAKSQQRGEIEVSDYEAPEQHKDAKGKVSAKPKAGAPDAKTPGIAVS